MKTLARLWRHLTTTRASGKKAFPDAALHAIGQAIADGERHHRAEVRVIIEASLDLIDVVRGMTARERARELFIEHGIWDTEENCGVLVYIELADHKVEIIADRAAARAVSAAEWQAVCKTMTQGFAAGRYEESVLAAIQQLTELLKVKFPGHGPTEDELPNRPLIV
jgi:uncharacterized membrane protein YgcG